LTPFNTKGKNLGIAKRRETNGFHVRTAKAKKKNATKKD